MPSTVRFLREYLKPAAGATLEYETTYLRGGAELPATVFRPAGDTRVLPGWVVLHGLTRTGRAHPALTRFVRAVACAGNVVLVPEIPEWRALRVAPALTTETIRAAVRALQQRTDVRHEHVGLFGFSFGATQALIAATDDETAALLSGIAAWGGYADLHRVFRFGLTGQHDIDGTTYRTQPDPYGAWIMAGNYLTRVAGHEDAADVATALLSLAREAGDRGLFAWEPVFDASKLRLRAGLPARHRTLFDLLAPTTTARRDEQVALELAERLATAVLDAEPQMDPRPYLPHVQVPVLFAHGRDDRLIPFSETLRLARAVPAHRIAAVTVTALFQHSGGADPGLGVAARVREARRFVALLHRLLRLV
jgi:pimeloyl-ACP methyl ester carboxylesterase